MKMPNTRAKQPLDDTKIVIKGDKEKHQKSIYNTRETSRSRIQNMLEKI